MNINKYETKDLALAAYLTAIGYTLRNHSKYNGETYFVFDQSQKTLPDWWTPNHTEVVAKSRQRIPDTHNRHQDTTAGND